MFVKTVVNEPRSAHDIIWSTQSEKPYKVKLYILRVKIAPKDLLHIFNSIYVCINMFFFVQW